MQGLAKAKFGFHQLEALSNGKSIIHSFNPLNKTIITFLYVIIVISFGRYELSGLIPLAFLPFFGFLLADIPFKPIGTRLAVALPFCAFAGITNIFLIKDPGLVIGDFTISLGWISFFVILVKTILSVSTLLIYMATTSMTDIANQLARLKVPKVLVLTLTMIYRYIGVALEEAINMYTSYMLRSPNRKGIRMKDMGPFVGQLFIRAIDRGERVYNSMKCRGFSGTFKIGCIKKPTAKEWVVTILLLGIVVFLRFANLSEIIGGVF